MEVESEYLRIVIERFESLKVLGDKTFRQISEEDIHWSYHEASNSIAIVVKHMSGNMVSRWTDFLISDGEKTSRKRDEEFEDDISSKNELLTLWESGWNALFTALRSLTPEGLLKQITIRGESHLVIEAIERQVAHYAYHVGQIVYIGKQIKGEEWNSLSIPRGKSEEYLKQMLEKHKGEEED
ncbi:Protein of unknown function [Thalassobacillus cyri]|uniref:DUF1572 domain-containing protein n=1 Tax=Thalassobacillus cyri TaxID=571932 RepID=A0A1H3W344_9BACI|nr:DUF1572 family protein [Thalassobacillus cyri]SDZ80732.1 Protein of unknown function [Thalassobacillus cyri]